MTLHQMHKCYDDLIDSKETRSEYFCKKMGAPENYETLDSFMHHLVYDEGNPTSLITAQIRARDNAMLLREIILSETLSYLEMSVALMKRNAHAKNYLISALQPVTDWSLSFFGSAQQRIYDQRVINLLLIGRCAENFDMMLRFDYPPFKLCAAFSGLTLYCKEMPDTIDTRILEQMGHMLEQLDGSEKDENIRQQLMHLVNVLVRV